MLASLLLRPLLFIGTIKHEYTNNIPTQCMVMPPLIPGRLSQRSLVCVYLHGGKVRGIKGKARGVKGKARGVNREVTKR